jgi:alpha-tubulin suppressor-like RCC1 family protein
LGIGSSTNVPTQVILHDGSDTPLVNLKAISAGYNHTCALFTDDSGACWGYDKDGQLANGKLGYSLPGPPWYLYDSAQTIFVLGTSGLEPLIMGGGFISVGGFHSCSLITDTPNNSIGCWGNNGLGQLGIGDEVNKPSAYAAVDERGKITDAIGLSSGRDFTCAIVRDQTVRCWGYNGDGQIGSPKVGFGDSQITGTPVVLDSTRLDKVVEVAAAEFGACAVCWGHDSSTGRDSTPFTRSVDAPLFTDNFDGN